MKRLNTNAFKRFIDPTFGLQFADQVPFGTPAHEGIATLIPGRFIQMGHRYPKIPGPDFGEDSLEMKGAARFAIRGFPQSGSIGIGGILVILV